MYKALFLIALAFGVASAQRWPMITVNAAGEIVLQSLTRAQSFQITPATVTTGPTSATTASLSTAASLTAGVSAFVVTTATSPATGHGVTLPTPSVGAQVTLIQSQTTFTSYTIWASSTSVFINNDASTNSVTVYSRRVVCTAISATRWNCIQDQDNVQLGNISPVVNVASATTMTVGQSGTTFAFTASATLTLPSCNSAALGVWFRFVVFGAFTATIASQSTDFILQGNIQTAAAAQLVSGLNTVRTVGTAATYANTLTAPGTAATSRYGAFNCYCDFALYWQCDGQGNSAQAAAPSLV
jgi:hypothetical protein